MLAVHDLEIRVGARLLMSGVDFRVGPGDKVGLVGRNGAGKTTLTKVLAGDLIPSDGTVTKSGEIGYLPQDPRSGDPEETARASSTRATSATWPRASASRRSGWRMTTPPSPRRR